MMLSRRRLITAFVCTACAVGLVAPAGAATQQDAERLITGLRNEAVVMASHQLSLPQKEQRFRQLLHTAFDLPAIGRFVLGRYWRTATPEQQREFLALFEDLTVYTWVKRFDEYGGEDIRVVSTREEAGGMMIDTRVERPKGPAIPVTWRAKDEGGHLRIVDIVVEGVSMAITHRSEYTSAIRSSGNVAGLLEAMRNKVNELRG